MWYWQWQWDNWNRKLLTTVTGAHHATKLLNGDKKCTLQYTAATLCPIKTWLYIFLQ